MSEPLQCITGVVSALVLHSGEEEFVRTAGQQMAGVGAAGALAVGGLAGAAAGAGMAASSAGDSVDFFTCKLGDQPVRGRFAKVTFREGDVLDMVISPQYDTQPLALAARRAADHMLWMVPHCSRGVKAHKRFAWRLLGWLIPAMPLLLFGLFSCGRFLRPK